MDKKILFLLLLLSSTPLLAQTFEAGIQLRPRYEFRNGYKTFLTEAQNPANFISQRSRFKFLFEQGNLEVKLSAQNISVWGEVPTMRKADINGISLFEAYGQYSFTPKVSMTLGRQVLSYDNQRILGEVDWAQQGQSHDALLMRWLPATGHRLDFGVAYNAPSETLFEVPYLVNSYKNLQFAWYRIDRENVGFSFLLMNTGYENESEFGVRDLDYLQTFGAFHDFSKGDFSGNIAGYGQTGYKAGQELSAWYAGAHFNYSLSQYWKLGSGVEYFSGTDMNNSSNKLNSFTPLFGTNHAFNGLMDYFYVGNHQNSVGLLDIYGKMTYSKEKFSLSVVPHFFSSTAEIINTDKIVQDDYLGTELDFSAGYAINRSISVHAGYSQMFSSESLEILKKGERDGIQNWAWIMVDFSPDWFSFSKAN